VDDTTKSNEVSKEKHSLGSFTRKEKRTIGRAMAMMTQIAFTVIGCIFAGVFLGRFLDNWLDTSPWLLIIFLLLGCLASFKGIIDVAKKF